MCAPPSPGRRLRRVRNLLEEVSDTFQNFLVRLWRGACGLRKACLEYNSVRPKNIPISQTPPCRFIELLPPDLVAWALFERNRGRQFLLNFRNCLPRFLSNAVHPSPSVPPASNTHLRPRTTPAEGTPESQRARPLAAGGEITRQIRREAASSSLFFPFPQHRSLRPCEDRRLQLWR